MYTTFINYAADGEILAKRIYADLLAAGVRPWLATYDLSPGDDYMAVMKNALQDSEFVVVLLTKKYWRTPENIALSEVAVAAGKTLIPVIADRGVKVPQGWDDAIQLKRRYADAVKDIIARLPADSEPLDEIPGWQRGNDAYFSGDFDAALAAYRQIKEETAITLNSRAAAYNALRKHEDARQDLDRAIELDPNVASFYRNRGLALAALGEHEAALVDDLKAIELDPDSPRGYSSQAMTLLALERFDEATKSIAEAISRDPDAAHYHYQHGLILSKMDDLDGALEAYEQALEIDPERNDAAIGRRIVLGRMGRHEEVLAEVDQDIKRNPRKAGNYITRSLINFYLERYEDAARDATAALERGKDTEPAALFNRAISRWQLGETDAAEQDFLAAIKLYPALNSAQGILDSAESDLTSAPALAILESLQASGKIDEVSDG
jgi:tetratricopeptide (TPR) repeat protein